METLQPLILVLWGILVAYVQERYGRFQDWTPRKKQLVNAVLAFVVPTVVMWAQPAWDVFVAPHWDASLGTSTDVVTGAILFVLPVVYAGISWLAGQIGHQFDGILSEAKKRLRL